MLPDPGPNTNHVDLMLWLYKKVTYLRRQVTLDFTADDIKNDATLCKLNANVNNRTVVAGCVGLFLTLK